MNHSKKITLQDFITKTVMKKNNAPQHAEIEFDGDYIPVERPSIETQVDYLNGATNAMSFNTDGEILGQDFEKMFDASRDFIFACCPYMQSKELREALECGEPSDVVGKVFGLEGTIDFASKIKEAFDVEKTVEKVHAEIKNS